MPPAKMPLSDSKFKDFGFILHQYPYTETSLILDVFTQNHGRLNLIAKGAKRPNSQLRPVLQLFQPLWLTYSGKNELKTLTKAEPAGAILHIHPQYILHILYIHELLMQLCPKQAPYPLLFNKYIELLNAFHGFSMQKQQSIQKELWFLKHPNQQMQQMQQIQKNQQINFDDAAEIELRLFEGALLKESGVGLYLQDLAWILDCPAQQNFIYLKNIGLKSYEEWRHQHESSPRVSAITLWAILTENFQTYQKHPDWQNILKQSKHLNRYILGTILPYDLKTRAVFNSLGF